MQIRWVRQQFFDFFENWERVLQYAARYENIVLYRSQKGAELDGSDT